MAYVKCFCALTEVHFLSCLPRRNCSICPLPTVYWVPSQVFSLMVVSLMVGSDQPVGMDDKLLMFL